MSQRAARHDLQCARGATLGETVEVWAPDTQTPAENLAPGLRVFFEGHPELVHSVRTQAGKVVVRLRSGLYSDPWFAAPTGADGLVMLARKKSVSWARAAFRRITESPANGHDPDHVTVQSVEIPTYIQDGTITLWLTPEETFAIPLGPKSWDLMAEVEGVRMRLLEGTLIAHGSDSVEFTYTIPPAFPEPHTLAVQHG